jgi:3-oxoacyl-[acyl-carrier protein] reductase
MKWILHCFLFLSFFAPLQASDSKKTPPTLIVTCATGELGGAIARQLAGSYPLILTGRNIARLEQLQEELRTNHPYRYQIVLLDYGDPASLDHFEHALTGSEIAGLVLITPRPQFGKNLLQSEPEWLQLFQSTFTGPLMALEKTIPRLSKHGKIVIIGGTTSVQVMPQYGPACVVRRMWTTYAKALSHQVGPQGLSVNVLSPGVVLTQFHTDRIQKSADMNHCDFDEQMEKDTAAIPLRRHAAPQEIAQAVQFLLSGSSDFMTGVNLIMDGGETVSY